MAVDGLRAEIERLRERIGRGPGSGVNEQNTKAVLIDPLLRALGWNVEDWEEVQREYRPAGGGDPVDYAVLDEKTKRPLLFVEAKALGTNLDDRRWIVQIMNYAHVADVQWVLLTNGDEYRIYNAYAEGPVEDKLFCRVYITNPETKPEETLAWLSKSQLEKNRIQAVWEAYRVDNKIRATVESLFAPEPDEALVNLIRKRVPDLSPREIRSGLKRLSFSVQPRDDVPAALAGEAAAVFTRKSVRDVPVKWGPRMVRTKHSPPTTRRHREVGFEAARRGSLKDLIAAGLIAPPLELQHVYKGHTVTARVEADGRVNVGGTLYSSLSAAGAAARVAVAQGLRNPQTDGWTFWRFRDENGQLQRIDVLRQQYRAGNAAWS
jgi:hypothetical protein